MKQTIIKMICLFLCITIIFSFTSYAAGSIVADSEAVLKDEKVYSNATVDQNFVDNHVLIVLNKEVGSINKVHSKNLFGSLDIKSVKDLTALKNYKTAEQRALQPLEQLQTESDARVYL